MSRRAHGQSIDSEVAVIERGESSGTYLAENTDPWCLSFEVSAPPPGFRPENDDENLAVNPPASDSDWNPIVVRAIQTRHQSVDQARNYLDNTLIYD